ncbi:MAG: hypothetical protein KKD77_23345 [Gammaproteobacteria bacterium]|nr:hypothetical protein [Gammaproteobacteria bacterium]
MRIPELDLSVDDAEILRTSLQEVAVEMMSRLDAERPAWEPYDHSRYNWASEIGHPCKKHLVHCRLDWRDRRAMSIDGRWRVREGIRMEWEAKKWLGDIGYQVTKDQMKFKTDDPGMERFADLWISGKIDGCSPLRRALPAPFQNLREVPMEIKTVAPHYFVRINTAEDLKRHSKFWIAKYPDQLNSYFAMALKPGGLFTIITFGKRPKIMPMLFDPDIWDRDCAVAREVNAHAEAGTYPEPIPFDLTVCGMCDFDHICDPLRTTRMTEVSQFDALKLDLYLELKEWKDKFDEMHAELIGDKKKPGIYRGLQAIVNDIEIKTRAYMRKVYREMTPAEKEAFFLREEEVVVTTIDRIEK